MSGHYAHPLRGLNVPGVELFVCRFDSAGAGVDPTATTIAGYGAATVTEDGTGVYHVAIDRDAVEVFGVFVSVESLQGGGDLLMASACVVSAVGASSIDDTASPIIIRVHIGAATNTPAAPASGRKVTVLALLKRTGA